MGDGGIGGNGISDAQAAEFAASQESIGLGTLGLTAGELADVTAGGVVGAYSMGNANAAPEGGGGGVQKLPEPRAWEATAEKAAAKGEQQAAITRKKRRRTLLTPEEGGTMEGSYPIYRRSILGI